jgi:Na+/phosphate symporter
MIIYLSLLIAIVGLVVYALAKEGKYVEIGRIMFGAGLLAFLLCICHGGVGFSVVPR